MSSVETAVLDTRTTRTTAKGKTERPLSEIQKLKKALDAARSLYAQEVSALKLKKNNTDLATFVAYESALNDYLSLVMQTQGLSTAETIRIGERDFLGALDRTKHAKKFWGTVAVGGGAMVFTAPIQMGVGIAAGFVMNNVIYKNAARGMAEMYTWGRSKSIIEKRETEAKAASLEGVDFKTFTGAENLLEKNLPSRFKVVSDRIRRERNLRLAASLTTAGGFALATGAGLSANLIHDEVGGKSLAGLLSDNGLGWLVHNNLITPAAAQDVSGPWRPSPHSGWPTQNGGHPVPQRVPMPRVNGGPNLQGVLINEFGQVVRQLEEGGHAHGGGYGGHGGYQEGGYQGEGRFGPNGDRMVGQHWEMVNGRRVLVTTWTHAEHHETYQHREVVQHHASVRHADCPPDKVTETRTPVLVDHVEKTLHKLGTHPFARSRAEAFDAAHTDKLIEQYRGAGKSPEFLAALKQWMIAEGKLETWNETTLDHNAKFALMANVFDKQGHLVHGVQLDTKETYIAESGNFTYTDTSGTHEITMVRPDKVGNNVGCNNFAIGEDEIIHTQTIHGCVADAAGGGARSITESNDSIRSVHQQMDAIPGGEAEVVKILRELGNPSIHQLLDRDYFMAHLNNVPDAEKPLLHAVRDLFHDHSHAFVGNADQYNNEPLLDALKEKGFIPEPASR